VNYLLLQVNRIKNDTNSRSDDVLIDHQVVSGHNQFWDESHYYLNLQNVIVKLQGEEDDALLVNCHFDSVPGSPGASDDIVSHSID
jgi:acetylornithine deacetylase/succinyl-diaminopimelate desuccinylase-like protein